MGSSAAQRLLTSTVVDVPLLLALRLVHCHRLVSKSPAAEALVVIAKLVAAAVRAPVMVLVLAIALLGIGLRSYMVLPIEAYPNPVAPMIEIIAQPQGWSAEEVERYVSLPLETGLVGMPGLEHIRSQSLFGLADVKCYFGWDTSYATAQQRVLNQLNFVTLPQGVSPELSPWSAIGELYLSLIHISEPTRRTPISYA